LSPSIIPRVFKISMSFITKDVVSNDNVVTGIIKLDDSPITRGDVVITESIVTGFKDPHASPIFRVNVISCNGVAGISISTMR